MYLTATYMPKNRDIFIQLPIFQPDHPARKLCKQKTQQARFNALSRTEPEKRNAAADFAHRIEPHRETLYRIAFGFTKERESALDLVQETFLQAITKHAMFKENNLAGWLVTILRNKFNNLYRDTKARPVRYEHDFSGKYDRASEQNMAEGNMLRETVQAAIGLLNDEDKLLVKLKYIDQLIYSEISERLNMPIGTIKGRLYFIRKILKKHLHEYSR